MLSTNSNNIRAGVSRFLKKHEDVREHAQSMPDETMRDCALIAKYIADSMDAYTWLHNKIGSHEWCDIVMDVLYEVV